MTRAPAAEVPAEVTAALHAAAEQGAICTVAGVNCYPPVGREKYWRVRFGATERSGGRTTATCYAAVLALNAALEPPAGEQPGAAQRGGASVARMLADYIAARGPSSCWSERTVRDRTTDFGPLVALGSAVECADLDAVLLRSFVDTAGTHGRGTHLLKITGTLLKWGWRRGYLTPAQAELAGAVAWSPPPGLAPARRPSRRKQAALHATTATGAPGGVVPTFDDITAWATACAALDPCAEGLVHAGACLGLRISELVLLTASSSVAIAGRGNYVDRTAFEVRVRWQVDGAHGTKAPKGSKFRDVCVPHRHMTGTGFDLRAWLEQRCEIALAEQEAGLNPDALLFPSPKGRRWGTDNLRNRVMREAGDTLGWAMDSYTTGTGRTITLRRFTPHSLRDRYATTAINLWRYTEQQLLEQGGWEDPETVRRYYAGVTDATHDGVRALHGL